MYPFLALIIAVPFLIYVANRNNKNAEYWHILKIIWKHKLVTYKRLEYQNYSIAYATRYSDCCLHIDVYLHKDDEIVGSMQYLMNSDDNTEKLTHDDISSDELKKFNEIIDLIDKDPNWI